MKFNISFLDVKEKGFENFDNFSINIEKLFLNQKIVLFFNFNVKDIFDMNKIFFYFKDDDIQGVLVVDERFIEIQFNNEYFQNILESCLLDCKMESKFCDRVNGKLSVIKDVYEVVYESDFIFQKNIFIFLILKKLRKRLYYEVVEDFEGLDCNDELLEVYEYDVDQYIRLEEEIKEIK